MNIIVRLLFAFGGVAAGDALGKSLGQTVEERELYAKRGRWIGGLVAFSSTFLIESERDTVNYTLKHNGKRVYDGISLKHRFEKRILEHRKNGKVFNAVIKDMPKPRSEALSLERKRIIRFSPKYNIHHNTESVAVWKNI